MTAIKNPQDLWSDSFVDDGEVTVSIDPDTNEFDTECRKMITLKCVEAFYDKDGKLNIRFVEK